MRHLLTTSSSKDEVREIASKGGQASHSGGFANMDPDKQVSSIARPPAQPSDALLILNQREIASKGGQASSGSFEKGSEKAKEAGRKGGLSSGGGNDDDE